MKRFFKKYERLLSVHHYIAVLRRQSVHVQRMYAAFFAGVITLLLGLVILYFDYDLWNEKYSRREDALEEIVSAPTSDAVSSQSPQDMMSDFFKEASQKLKAINLNGTETYTKEEGTSSR